jgi:hypothetical protein
MTRPAERKNLLVGVPVDGIIGPGYKYIQI